MKTHALILAGISFLLLSFLTFTACEDESANPIIPSLNPGDSTGWRVTWFWDKDKDETSDFGQYTFYFRDGGVFDAVSGGQTVSGTWRTTSDDGLPRLVLSTTTTKPLSELADDWVIVFSGENRIELGDDNDTHVEELIFEKIQ